MSFKLVNFQGDITLIVLHVPGLQNALTRSFLENHSGPTSNCFLFLMSFTPGYSDCGTVYDFPEQMSSILLQQGYEPSWLTEAFLCM